MTTLQNIHAMGSGRRSRVVAKVASHSATRRGVRRGLTLVEVLLAVFILGIGVISIAAIFPAGIAQQRQSNDDTIGSIVADNAIALIRTRLDPSYFGPPSFGGNQPAVSIPGSVPGDFGWARPGFVTANNGTTIDGLGIPKGSIVVFSPSGGPSSVGGTTVSEVPWNENLFGNAPPNIVFTQRDRYWPMTPTYPTADIDVPRPQYVWEAMFRRFQGRIQVAIFVYRVTRPGGESGPYVVQANPSSPAIAPLPIRIDLASDFQIWDSSSNEVPQTGPGTPFAIDNDLFSWQLPGQWLLDQNNTVHRVLSGRRRPSEGPVRLTQPPPPLTYSFVYAPLAGVPVTVSTIWCIPLKDNAGNTLTPVFVTVREL